MRERPILFNGDMVRAILDGRKAQTRRVVKLRPGFDIEQKDDGTMWPWAEHPDRGGDLWMHSPYGQPGDLLWVRETWQQVHPLQVTDGRYSQAGYAGIPGPPPVNYRTIYRADGDYPPIYSLGGEPWPYRSLEPFERDGMQAFVEDPCWTPSIHMPRWASRVLLEITGVRVERLQAISTEDAIAEGVASLNDDPLCNPSRYFDCKSVEAGRFRDIWISTGGDWNANPWVWVITFKRVPA